MYSSSFLPGATLTLKTWENPLKYDINCVESYEQITLQHKG